jgi:hypothetical protein
VPLILGPGTTNTLRGRARTTSQIRFDSVVPLGKRVMRAQPE